MTILEAITVGLRKSFTITGRATRPEFWWLWAFHFFIPVALIFALVPTLTESQPHTAQIMLVAGMCLYFASLPAVFCALVRRQHDIGESGKIPAAIYLITIFLAVAATLIVASSAQIDSIALLTDEQVEDNPMVVLILAPVIFIQFFSEVLLLMLLILTILAIVGPLILVFLLFLGIGLAQPSENAPNKYGPNPHEVTS